MATRAQCARFTVLVEIKKPESPLLGPRYRNRAFPPSESLAGGVAQLQSNCRTWVEEGSDLRANRELLGDVLTCEPRGILVIGNTRQLDEPDKMLAFESFRRNMHNPEVITYDELLARAQFAVHVLDPQ